MVVLCKIIMNYLVRVIWFLTRGRRGREREGGKETKKGRYREEGGKEREVGRKRKQHHFFIIVPVLSGC